MLRSKLRRQSTGITHTAQHEQVSRTATDSQSLSSQDEVNSEGPPDQAAPAIEKRAALERPIADSDIEGISSSMSALKFVPPSIRFGRGGRRGGFSRS